VQAYLYFAAQSPILGWIAAVGAFLGIEAIGGASCYAVVKLHRQRNYGIEFAVSLAGILAYVGSGYFVLHNTAILIFFILAPFSYFAYAILRNMQDEHIEKMSETEAQVRLIEAQTKQINAETRKAKAAIQPVQPVQLDRLDTLNLSRECRADVQLLLDSDPTLSAREIGRRLDISQTTASEHKKLWLVKNG
jgi:cation transport ATPase